MRRFIKAVTGGSVACTLILTSVSSAQAGDTSTGNDGSQPLPGYTFSSQPLPPINAQGGQTTVIQGVYQHALFDLEIPPHWNGQLVMWAHGSRGNVAELTVDPPWYGLRQTFADEGYAWAASSYTVNGFDVRSGIVSTHDLAVFTAGFLHRQPSRTYLMGISMGGQVTVSSLERYRGFYAGAMPMCGALGDDRLFDYVASYNLLAQDLAGVRAYPLPAHYYDSVVPVIEQRLGIAGLTPGQSPTNAAGQQFRSIVEQLTGGSRPGLAAAFAYWADPLFTFQAADNGGPLGENFGRLAQNVTTVYAPNSPVDVNRTVQRIVPVDLLDRLSPGLTPMPQVFGDPDVPVLTLHDLGDLLLPLSMEQSYAREVAAHGRSNLLVQRVVRAADHCEFSNAEAAQAWTDLQRWVESGAVARPAGDPVLDPKEVAAPTYGCRFTDPAAQADPAAYPTHAYYPACPAPPVSGRAK